MKDMETKQLMKRIKNITYEEADANYIEEIKNYIGEKDLKAFHKLLKISKKLPGLD